jgi:Tol biopolymer transport system component
LMAPDVHTQIQTLLDRARLAQSVSDASVDLITLSNETLFTKNYEYDFGPVSPDEKNLPSPDGKLIAERKRGPDDNYYIYMAKAPKKGYKPNFKRLGKTSGAYAPAWSPDSQKLVYCRIVNRQRQLEQLDLKSMAAQILFVTKSANLGIHPVYHPAGNKIAYVYEGRICLINIGNQAPVFLSGLSSSNNPGDAYFKQLLKTKQKLDYTAELQWSLDGTMIRFHQTDKKGKLLDELLFLDVTTSNNP